MSMRPDSRSGHEPSKQGDSSSMKSIGLLPCRVKALGHFRTQLPVEPGGMQEFRTDPDGETRPSAILCAWDESRRAGAAGMSQASLRQTRTGLRFNMSADM